VCVWSYPNFFLPKQRFVSDLKLILANSTEAELRSLSEKVHNYDLGLLAPPGRRFDDGYDKA